MRVEPETRDLLRLTLTPGMGPVLIARLIDALGSAERVLGASAQELERVKGIGGGRSGAFVRGMNESGSLVDGELEACARLGVSIIARTNAAYPPLLRQVPDAPPLLYVRGSIEPAGRDKYPVAIVGSRNATAYGVEQAERFAGVLGMSGLTIVSGGARGVDTAAHRGAVKSGGRTIAVLGCGLATCYPPENENLFDSMVASGSGAVVSELPLSSPPESENFPARNRLISGICLGVIVIEAGKKSGSLITARLAAEDHGREVMAIPGRVDSAASWGTHELLKQGGAAMVTEPGDVLQLLETPARHSHAGTHEARYADPAAGLFQSERKPLRDMGLTDAQAGIMAELIEPRTMDELARSTGLAPGALRAEVTILELQRRVVRQGTRISRSSK